MGGYGSTRWRWYSKKTQAEECFTLRISKLKRYLIPWQSGNAWWTQGETELGRIGYQVIGSENFPNTPEGIRLFYTIGAKSRKPVNFDYTVRLTTSYLAWDKVRYWFVCPTAGCGRRVGCLYLPSDCKYFACRHCCNLTYQTRQEGYKDRPIYNQLAAIMQDKLPGATWRDIKRLLNHRY